MESEKKSLDDLAIFGGPVAFSDPLHVGAPNMGDRQKLLERFAEILDKRWFTNDGPFVKEFEKRLEEYTGVRHCIAVTNATIAMELVVRAVGMEGEVIVPSYTFIATAHAVQWQGIVPVFCDIDCRTHNINPQRIYELLTPRTTGIIGVHLWGRPCDVEMLEELAREKGLKLVFDAAHAFGCMYQGQRIGAFGSAEVFSFHATKFMNSFEGGVIATNDDDLAEKVRLMRNFGFAGIDKVVYVGTNGKMTEIQAAMGLTSLESVQEFMDVNRQNYNSYKQGLADINGISLIEYNEQEKPNYQYVVVEVDEECLGLSRDDIIRVLWEENIRARRYFFPGCHMMEPYRTIYPHAGQFLTDTVKVAARVIVLPTGTAIGVEEIRRICEVIRLMVHNKEDFVRRRDGRRQGCV